uniref:Putative FCF1 small subunit n=1 Tax=Oryza punctata TaxID=4537 RepID=A0A1V1H1S7_ORYPU|nr:putative FCF1 small subunit [Oryza punctata]
MGRAKNKGPKFAAVKKIITKKTIQKYKEDVLNPKKKDNEKEKLGRNVPQVSSALFFSYNTALGPPYRVIVDTNFINFSIQNKLDLEKGMMDCLYAKCTPCITDCVMAELEKLGQKYRVALRIAKDPRFQRLACTHKGTYADDCIVERVTQHKCYIVATCDRDLKRRIRKVPGVPIMYITRHRYSIERLPEATIGGAFWVTNGAHRPTGTEAAVSIQPKEAADRGAAIGEPAGEGTRDDRSRAASRRLLPSEWRGNSGPRKNGASSLHRRQPPMRCEVRERDSMLSILQFANVSIWKGIIELITPNGRKDGDACSH